MYKNFILLCGIFFAASCKMLPDSDKRFADPEGTTYRLRLSPTPGSKYHYDIVNTTEMQLELEGKELNNVNKSTVGITYDITKDSSGGLVFKMLYDQIRLHVENGDMETDADAKNASLSLDPLEKMLGILKDARLVAIVTPAGEVKQIDGYEDLKNRLMADLDPDDLNARNAARAQLDKLIGQEMIQKNLDQLFKIFPDSAVHVGERWKLNSKQGGDIGLNVKSSYRLKDINADIALVDSKSEIESENATTNVMGYAVTPSLKGTQEGRYEIEATTGMLISGKIVSEIKGTLQLMGKEVPITIKMKVQMNGARQAAKN